MLFLLYEKGNVTISHASAIFVPFDWHFCHIWNKHERLARRARSRVNAACCCLNNSLNRGRVSFASKETACKWWQSFLGILICKTEATGSKRGQRTPCSSWRAKTEGIRAGKNDRWTSTGQSAGRGSPKGGCSKSTENRCSRGRFWAPW